MVQDKKHADKRTDMMSPLCFICKHANIHKRTVNKSLCFVCVMLCVETKSTFSPMKRKLVEKSGKDEGRNRNCEPGDIKKFITKYFGEEYFGIKLK